MQGCWRGVLWHVHAGERGKDMRREDDETRRDGSQIRLSRDKEIKRRRE